MNSIIRPLVINNLSMTFEGSQPVLDQVNFELAPGSVTGLLGKNGAGKTTLMRIALGLLSPDAGDIRLFDTPAWTSPASIRKRIGYVPQAEVGFAGMRVSDALTLVSSFYDTWDDTLINRYLTEWELDSSAYIQNLSKGQQQKVAILMAIGHHPDLLILDEPVASLDPGGRRQFLQALVEMNERENQTILFSTHITSDLERVAAEVAVIHGAKLQFHGELDALKEGCQRLHFEGESLPAELSEPGISNYVLHGTRAHAFATEWSSHRAETLASSLGARVTAQPLPLEELFLEMTHG